LEISIDERRIKYATVRFFNHEWDNPEALKHIGNISAEEIKKLSDGLFAMEVPVNVSRRIFAYDQLIIVGPVFPHEVVGFSGGNKYLFPGVSGPEVLNFFHWLGAVVTNPMIIGNIERFLALHEFESEARERLPHAVYEYVAGGADDEHSIRANEESFRRIFLRPRVLQTVTPVDLGQELFGRPLPAPVLLAPAAYQRLMHPDGELGSVQGAIRHGVPFVLSSNGTVSIEEIMAVPGARCWFQLYVQGDRGFTRDSIARVDRAGRSGWLRSSVRDGRYASARVAAPPNAGRIQYSV
jgi:FMN-dependent dehydrogenase/Lactate racemase N-terminal domain